MLDRISMAVVLNLKFSSDSWESHQNYEKWSFDGRHIMTLKYIILKQY